MMTSTNWILQTARLSLVMLLTFVARPAAPLVKDNVQQRLANILTREEMILKALRLLKGRNVFEAPVTVHVGSAGKGYVHIEFWRSEAAGGGAQLLSKINVSKQDNQILWQQADATAPESPRQAAVNAEGEADEAVYQACQYLFKRQKLRDDFEVHVLSQKSQIPEHVFLVMVNCNLKQFDRTVSLKVVLQNSVSSL